MVMGCNGLLNSFSEVVPQMTAVCDLDRLRRPGTGCFGICARTVTADHLRARMRDESLGDGAGRSVRTSTGR